MKPSRTTLLSVMFPMLIIAAPSSVLAHGAEVHLGAELSANKLLQADASLRNLWLEHSFWVRNVVIATYAGDTAAITAAENEAVNNARQIAAAMEPFYGKPAADKLFTLLAGHYGAVKQYLDATRNNQAAAQELARTSMFSNAEQLAIFLSSANPNLPIDAVRGMLLAHGGHHISQITQLRDRQYAEEAQTWGEMKNHMYAIADALAQAIATQFPAKFK
ncbi:MAG: hypothetical protein V4447_02445 [Pseudomonadota bacterium]